jgi:uncharacterized protein YhaN
MRIDEIAVDGFSLIRDRRLEPAAGLTLIRGENEAGKSTLLAFIRAILFGFEPKSPAALAGGRRGGWLTVTPADGRQVRIERYGITGGSGQLRLLDNDGNDLGAETLTRILQGVEKSVYRNIFAFGLAELTEFDTLTGPAIADRIYGAGMGTGATSVVEVENALEKLRSDIFVKRGRIPRINVLLAEIEELDSRIEAINPPEVFRAAGGRRTLLEAELATLSVEAESIGTERRRLERLRDGWSSWLALGTARARLAGLPADPAGEAGYPADLLERLARVERDLARLGEQRAELATERDRLTAEEASAAVDAALLAVRPAAEALLGALADARTDRIRLADQDRDLGERSSAVTEALRRLGPGWDEARAADVDDSVEARGAISGPFRTLLDTAERDLAAARSSASTAAQNQADARSDLAAVATPGSIAPLEAMPAGWARPEPRGSGSLVNLTWILIGLLVGLAAGEGALLLGLGLALAVVAGLVVGAATAIGGPLARRSGAHVVLGATPVDTSAAARLSERTERVHLLEERARLAEDRLRQATQAHEQAAVEWRTWLGQHGLPQEVDRETALRLLDGVTAVRTNVAACQTVQARRDATAARLLDFEGRSKGFLVETGRVAGDDPLAAIDAVGRDLAATVGATATRDRALRELARIEASAAANEAALQAARAEQAAIFSAAGADDGAGVRAGVAGATHRAGIEREIRTAQDTLVALSGPGDVVAAFEADLATVEDLARIQADLAVELERARALEEQRAAILEQLGAERETIARIERSAEAAELRQHRADRIAELGELAESWSVSTIAVALLRRTRERYEREHRPEVLRAAEELLAAWTGGRYVRILAPLGRQVQELGRSDGVNVPLTGLSTGTAQQLYLALRFGLVDHFGRQAESLPIVMDDILVNFDPVRAERAARSIEELAGRHQVLYFTCHPGTPLNAAKTIELPALVRS